MYYYFAFASADPTRSSFKETEISVEEMRSQFVGKWIKTGDEPHDIECVTDIWTTAQVKAYYND